jgi:hypothetical protein
MTTTPLHTFHIPVMGLAYTIDSPIRVAQYGISSVIPIADDDLIEKMRNFYSAKFNQPYEEISQQFQDYRAKRITSYLNLVDKIVKQKFENFKTELAQSRPALEHFISMLPNGSTLKKGFHNLMAEGLSFKENIQNYMESQLSAGAIDVNIMTKLDKDNFDKNGPLPIEFNDAHAALRGFANSTLESSVVLSAGMNPRLYSYFENFSDFYPNEKDQLKKKIILKVSDFRSALIQGNFLAKKGLWVSEYRIESGLNCGGHAFATDGLLLGPILEEFKQKKEQLIGSAHELMTKALVQKQRHSPRTALPLKITFQGGVGTAEEHAFLLNTYALDTVGWGSPFLLVPEATTVDQTTRTLLINAKEEDFYLSHISPLGVPFNTVKGTTNDQLKQKRIQQNKAGSSCPKKFLALSKEYDSQGICTASRKYQQLKLAELLDTKENLSPDALERSKIKITEKACLCVGLANSAYIENDIPIKGQAQGVVICPGPNMAYFNREVSLRDMMQHIYGNKSIISTVDRPNFLVKELKMYVAYLKKEIESTSEEVSANQYKKWQTFKTNLLEGIRYYHQLVSESQYFNNDTSEIKAQFNAYQLAIDEIRIPQ